MPDQRALQIRLGHSADDVDLGNRPPIGTAERHLGSIGSLLSDPLSRRYYGISGVYSSRTLRHRNPVHSGVSLCYNSRRFPQRRTNAPIRRNVPQPHKSHDRVPVPLFQIRSRDHGNPGSVSYQSGFRPTVPRMPRKVGNVLCRYSACDSRPQQAGVTASVRLRGRSYRRSTPRDDLHISPKKSRHGQACKLDSHSMHVRNRHLQTRTCPDVVYL